MPLKNIVSDIISKGKDVDRRDILLSAFAGVLAIIFRALAASKRDAYETSGDEDYGNVNGESPRRSPLWYIMVFVAVTAVVYLLLSTFKKSGLLSSSSASRPKDGGGGISQEGGGREQDELEKMMAYIKTDHPRF